MVCAWCRIYLLNIYSTHPTGKIMNKFLAIVASTGLIAAFAGTAQAQTATVNFTGPVAPNCTTITPTGGTLVPNPSSTKLGTQFSGGADGKFVVICNSSTSTLNFASPVLKYNSATVVNFPNNQTTIVTANGGNGIYLGATGTVPFATAAATSTTKAAGDTINVRTLIETTNNTLIQSGAYDVEVPATLAP
jgi:hypothetical protein